MNGAFNNRNRRVKYIPKDIFDAFAELNRLTDPDSRNKFMPISKMMRRGNCISASDVGLRPIGDCTKVQGSVITYVKAGISFPEDQAMAIVVCWHRSLNKKDINFKQVKEVLAAKRKKEREERLKKMPVIEEVIKNPPPNKN